MIVLREILPPIQVTLKEMKIPANVLIVHAIITLCIKLSQINVHFNNFHRQKSNVSFIFIGTQSICTLGLSSNHVVSSRDENEPETTTEFANLRQRQRLPEPKSPETRCVNHRDKVRNQYECQMLSHTCGDLTSEKEVTFEIFY